jgi:thioesterase domain-containing protein
VTPERSVRAGTTDDPPLVALHTWRGEADNFAALSAALGGTPVYSLLPPDPEHDVLPRRVEQWVDHHAAVLATLPIAPPYRFVGWSFGGVVAVELTRRLRDAGTDVDFVGLIDTIRPRVLPLSDREYVWYHLGAAAAMAADERAHYLRQKAGYLFVRRYPRLGGGTRTLLLRLGYRRNRAERVSVKPTDPLQVSVHTAYLNYRGDTVPFPVHLYGTAESITKAREPALRWVPWLHAGYELATIPGEHFTLFAPDNVEGLADAIRTSLRASDVR